MEYLDFELPIKELEDQLDKCQIIGQESDVDVTTTCKQIEKKLEAMIKKMPQNNKTLCFQKYGLSVLSEFIVAKIQKI